jgi:nucleotide-binding universal stress UspA family protein
MQAGVQSGMHLLLGVGDTDDGLQALETTVSRARATGDDLTVAVYSGGDSLDDLVTAVRDRLETLDFEVAVERLEGDAGGQLVDLGDRAGVDRIVLFGGHRSPLGKVRLDRVTEFVLLNASVSVTLLR